MGQKKDSKSEKGVLETIREVNRKDRMKRISSESERIKKAAHEKDLADEAYRKELQKDKIELIKIKQGIKEEDEIKQDETKYTFLQKVGAFFYCNKPMVITASFFIFLAGFLIYDLARKDRPDVTAMIITSDENMETCYENIASVVDEYIVDVNENGEIHSTMYYLPFGEDIDPYTFQASSTKLFAFMQDGETMLVIASDEVEDYVFPEKTLENLEELYPDNEHIKGHGFYFAGTKFAEEIGYEGELPDDVYIGIRKVSKGARYREKMQKNYDHAKAVLDGIIDRYS